MEISIDLTLDLRGPALLEQLALSNAPACFLDKSVARAVAGFLRATTPAQAIVVPSMAFVDDPDRFLVVCFLDKLPADTARWISPVEPESIFSLRLDTA